MIFYRKLPSIKQAYEKLRSHFQPRYRLKDPVYFPETPAQPCTYRIWGDWSCQGEEIATDAEPNEAMEPINWTARLRVSLWKRRLRRALPKQMKARRIADAAGGYFAEADTTPIVNFIPEPRPNRKIDSTKAGWYANPPSPPVVSFKPTVRNPPVKSPWLEPKKD